MNIIILLLVTMLTCSCSSGGSSSGDGSSSLPIVYTGKTSQATITSANALKLFLFAWGGGPSSSSSASLASLLGISKISSYHEGAAPAFSQRLRQFRQNKVLLAAAAQGVSTSTPVHETYYGSVSGTAIYSGYVNADGTGQITIIYSNYNDGDNITYDGDATLTIYGYDPSYNLFTNVDMEMNHLTFQGPDTYYSLTGIVHTDEDVQSKSETTTFHVDGLNEVIKETFRLENYTIQTSCDDLFSPKVCSESSAGRVYVATEGYTDVSVSNPLLYNHYGQFNVDVPDAGGPLLISGANSKERVSPLSVNQLRIEVDSDGDSVYESSRTYLWTDLTGLIFKWENAIGTAGYDEAYSVQQTPDGGFVAAGYTNTNSANQLDTYLVKTDAAGDLEWSKTYGGTDNEVAQSVQVTSDGGFIIAGYSYPFGTGGEKIYVVKTDALGNIEWEKKFDALVDSEAYAIQETSDGGFVIAGYMVSFLSGTGLVGFGGDDVYVLKINAQGDAIWDKRFGGLYDDHGYSVRETLDGGFIIAGTTSSFEYDTKREQVYLIKTDSEGNALWEKTFGGIYSDYGYDAKEIPGGGYIVSGYRSGNNFYLIKTDADGGLIWEKTLSSTYSLYSKNALELASGGGFVVAGTIDRDMALIKVDSDGGVVWERRFNWSNYLTDCQGFDVKRTTDGGYVIAGYTWPAADDKDFYLVKTDADGHSK